MAGSLGQTRTRILNPGETCFRRTEWLQSVCADTRRGVRGWARPPDGTRSSKGARHQAAEQTAGTGARPTRALAELVTVFTGS